MNDKQKLWHEQMGTLKEQTQEDLQWITGAGDYGLEVSMRLTAELAKTKAEDVTP